MFTVLYKHLCILEITLVNLEYFKILYFYSLEFFMHKPNDLKNYFCLLNFLCAEVKWTKGCQQFKRKMVNVKIQIVFSEGCGITELRSCFQF